MNAHPIIIPAIAEDGSLYPVEKLKAHEDGLFHLAISIFVFDGEHLLIQKRAASKYHCGGLWANTCCSHPYWDEPSDSCARRRLNEELGFNVPLSRRRVVEYSADVGGGLHEHEKVTMYVGSADRATLEVKPNPLEVDEVRWVTPADLATEIAEHPERFTPWFRIYAERYPDLHV
ncbi:isopentenyl-diphosphate delta-isomerase, type 1 [Hoeflea phototrophica DFL-43]|jgi:isopentenyl-diphosphate delta-isomerase|uniref:Isopentenyl-diphosphate Delta-isomerase n=1 Tax=Hoeflea phototrophica (strain DSM 17068 / NCIMB 14078 / DFL-43) TaxID=411684 RepID=A9DA77_HOEPD|nr:isopentenyl-diphosphate delta-isomerase [Hoeflea phototrophica]EDQ32684.1 isopentenyl-diphosphate delta-isomerase, type 1 [Hoeflea phototrophica DFL-43]